MVLSAQISGTPSLKRTASCMQDDGLAWDNASPMGVSMRPSFNIPYAHYAMIYLDNMGRVKMAESPSIQEQNGTVFTPEIRDRFLEILGAKIGYHRPMIRKMSGVGATPYGYGHPSEMSYHQGKRRRPSPPNTTYDMHASESFSDSVEDLTPYSPADMVGLEIGNTPKILEYYERALKHFQQLNCRQIAKAFIKFIEPRKQVKHPYNGGKPPAGAAPGEKGDPEKTKPEWWPAEVVHKEPDHLRKDQRLTLLIHIIRKLGRFGITPDKLQEVAYDCKRQLKGPERLLILDEIFRVRKMEEQYEKGEIDASTLIYVINRESSPKQDKDGDSLGDGEQKAEGEESTDRDILTPTSSEASTTVSTITSVDHLSMTAPTRPIQYGDRNPLFPLPESLSFGESSRESGSFYSTTTEYADDYSSPHILRTPANSTLVSPHEAPAAFDYLTHAPLPASTAVEQIPRQAALPMHSGSFDQWPPSFRQNIFGPMEYGAAPGQAIPQPAMNYPHPHSHGLPDLCRERPHMDVMSVRAPACL